MNDDIFRLLNDLQINALLFFSLLCGILLAFIMNVIFFFRVLLLCVADCNQNND